jgi:hypothetical protein
MSGGQGSNLRPHGPKPRALPNLSYHPMHAPFHSPRTYTVPTRSRVDRTRTCNNPRSKRGNLASGSLLYIKTSRVKRTRTSNNLHSKWSNLASGSPPYKRTFLRTPRTYEKFKTVIQFSYD